MNLPAILRFPEGYAFGAPLRQFSGLSPLPRDGLAAAPFPFGIAWISPAVLPSSASWIDPLTERAR